MFNILNNMMRTSTRTETWNAPHHWKSQMHKSTYERQAAKADEYRRRMELDVRFMR